MVLAQEPECLVVEHMCNGEQGLHELGGYGRDLLLSIYGELRDPGARLREKWKEDSSLEGRREQWHGSRKRTSPEASWWAWAEKPMDGEPSLQHCLVRLRKLELVGGIDEKTGKVGECEDGNDFRLKKEDEPLAAYASRSSGWSRAYFEEVQVFPMYRGRSTSAHVYYPEEPTQAVPFRMEETLQDAKPHARVRDSFLVLCAVRAADLCRRVVEVLQFLLSFRRRVHHIAVLVFPRRSPAWPSTALCNDWRHLSCLPKQRHAFESMALDCSWLVCGELETRAQLS